jgi:adenylyltransferase/sulfurtransferase
VVVDCTDNFAARYAINAACLRQRKRWVSAAAIRFAAQVSVFQPAEPESPCYACLYPNAEESAETCTQTGVAAPLLGIVGSIQALEVIKLITGAGESLQGRLLILDGLRMQWQTVRFRKDPRCLACGSTT